MGKRCKYLTTYPFAKGTLLYEDNDSGMDMEDVILTYNGTCGLPCMKEPLERLLSNQTALRERQWKLREYAMLSSFALENESLEYPDAFMATIVSLRHKLWRRMGKPTSGRIEEGS